LKTALSFLLALNLIIPILLVTFLPLQSISAQIPYFNNQTDLPLTYKVKIDYKEYQFYSTLPPGPKLTSTIDATFSAQSLVHLGPFGDYVGNATGHYKEIQKDASACGEEGTYNLLLEGNATMDVRINPELREVSVGITGYNLTHVESYTGCGDNYRINAQDGQASAGCVFYDVNLQTGGTYRSDGYVEYKDEDDLQDVGCVMVISTLEDKIEIAVDKPELSPLDSDPKSKVKVTATRVDGSKIAGMRVKIESCPSIGKADTDGHIHDRRNDPCDGGRPPGTIKYNGAAYFSAFEATTDANGEIALEYSPAWQQALLKNYRGTPHLKLLYISGEDRIIAEKVDDNTVKDEETITTKVRDLVQMPGSANCGDMAHYYFVPQGQHKCIFYGTPTTNSAVERIAQAFMDKQNECKNNPGGICALVDANGNNVTFTITGDNKKLRITAMSLPWGGTHDIKGDWRNPHVTHNNGKMIDIGTADFKTVSRNAGKVTVTTDKDRMLLLWHIIRADGDFGSFPKGEGEPFELTADHFHINFRN
jgi:hypothetical protein